MENSPKPNDNDQDSDRLAQTNARLSKRDDALADLAFGVVTNAAQFLRADFGSARLNGLAIEHFPTAHMAIRKMTVNPPFIKKGQRAQMAELRRIGGWGGYGQNIYLNPNYLDILPLSQEMMRERSGILSHETIHFLQTEARRLDKRMPGIVPVISVLPRFPENSFSVCLRDTFNRASIELQKTWKSLRRSFLDTIKYPLSVRYYLSSSNEMQARLQEILVPAYAHWQVLPATRPELYAALCNAGLEMPSGMVRALIDNQDGLDALQKFACPPELKPSFSHAVKDLNLVYRYASNDAAQKYLWDHVYPLLYGTLIEMYGDIPGRERLGLGANPRRALQLADYITTDSNLTEDDIAGLCADLPVELALTISNLAVRYGQTPVLGHLLKRSDIRNALADHTGFNDDCFQDPLFRAVTQGRGKAVALLAAAGHPVQKKVPFFKESLPLLLHACAGKMHYDGNVTMNYARFDKATLRPGLTALAQHLPQAERDRILSVPKKSPLRGLTLGQALEKLGFPGPSPMTKPALTQNPDFYTCRPQNP